MSSFKGNVTVVLQPNDKDVSYRYSYPIKTSVTDASEYLPYGTTISGVTVTAWTSAGVNATTDMITGTSVSTNYIDVMLQYPSSNGVGDYTLRFILTLSNSSTMETDFDRIIARDL